jgi:outer membrane murein-binding lipoprotein Lpp
MSKTQFSGITIILFVVLLVVGLGGGYFFATSSLQPKIDDLTKQVSDRNSQITALNTQVSEKDGKITQLNTTVKSLQGQITTLTNEKQTQATQIISLNQQLQTKDDTITDKNNQITILNNRVTPESGYLSVNLYGFSFDAPLNTTITTSGIQDAVANQQSGMINIGKSAAEPFYVLYIYRTVSPDIDASIDTARLSIASYNPVYSPRVTTTINGYTMKYERYTAIDSTGKAYGVWGYVYCSKLNYYFGISGVFYNEAQTTRLLNNILNTLYLPN